MKYWSASVVTLGFVGNAAAYGFSTNSPPSRLCTRFSMQNMGYPPLPNPFPPKRENSLQLREGEVSVRFINTQSGKDAVVAAEPGEMLTSVALRAGVKIATSCRSGLCGTCTTDIEDPNWPPGKSYRPGYQTIKACVTKVVVPPGCDEMVLDVYRNSSSGRKLNKNLLSKDMEKGLNIANAELPQAMSRFEENWEKDFKPDYKQDINKSQRSKESRKTSEEEEEFSRSVGTSRLRSRTLDSVMNLNSISKRFVPRDWTNRRTNRFNESAIQAQPQYQKPADDEQSESLRKHELPDLSPEEEGERRTMGASRLREAAYQRALRRNTQVRYIREIDSLSIDSEEIQKSYPRPNSTPFDSRNEEMNTENSAIGIDFTGPMREFARKEMEKNRRNLSIEDEALKQQELEAAVARENYFPDFSRRERAPVHPGPFEMNDSLVTNIGDAYDAHTGNRLPPGVMTGSMVQQGPSKASNKSPPCSYCNSTRRVLCYECEGTGEYLQEIKPGIVLTKTCYLCMGKKALKCPECRSSRME